MADNDENKPLAAQLFEAAMESPSHGQQVFAQLLMPRPGFDYTADIKADLTERKVIDISPDAKEALIRSAELTYAKPAEEKTKQVTEETKQEIRKAEEETKRAAEVTKRSFYDTIKNAYPLIAAALGLGAVVVAHIDPVGVALIVGVVAAKPIVETVADKLKKGGDTDKPTK